MVGQEMIQMRLTGIRLKQKFLVVVLLGLVAVDQALGVVVFLAGGPAEHLEHVRDRVVHVTLLLAVVTTGVHYHHAVGLKGQVPGEFVGADYYLD